MKNNDVQGIDPLGHHGEVLNKTFRYQRIGASKDPIDNFPLNLIIIVNSVIFRLAESTFEIVRNASD